MLDPGRTRSRVVSEDVTKTLDLIQRAQNGDRDALGRVLARYSERVRRIVRARLGKRLRRLVDSGDILQETLLVAVRKWQDYDVPDEASVVNLLARIAQHKITDVADRANSKKGNLDLEVSMESGDSQASGLAFDPPNSDTHALDRQIRRERQEIVDDCLAELPEAYRELILQRDFAGHSWKEVARLTGRPSENAARMAYGKALMELTKLVRRHGGMESSTGG
jgi:RNA polymerase sigma-70 factor (ECF subfamily)